MTKHKVWICCALAAVFVVTVNSLVCCPVASASTNKVITPVTRVLTQKAPAGEEQIILACRYPVLSSYAGTYFSYNVDIQYTGGKGERVFDLRAEVPPGFTYSITPSYEGTEIGAIRLSPERTYPETIKLTVRPSYWLTPEPGEYKVTFHVSSGDLKSSIELKAIVTAKYDMKVEPSTGRYNTEVTAGDDNYFSVTVSNTGTAPLEKIAFSSAIAGNPSGWSITFSPDKIETLAARDTREVQVNIKPARKTIAGDYMITISAEPEGKTAYAKADVRVTVLVPTVWGWVGVGIIMLVIAGLAVLFMRLGRR